jgi:hypothetical protein
MAKSGLGPPVLTELSSSEIEKIRFKNFCVVTANYQAVQHVTCIGFSEIQSK